MAVCCSILTASSTTHFSFILLIRLRFTVTLVFLLIGRYMINEKLLVTMYSPLSCRTHSTDALPIASRPAATRSLCENAAAIINQPTNQPITSVNRNNSRLSNLELC